MYVIQNIAVFPCSPRLVQPQYSSYLSNNPVQASVYRIADNDSMQTFPPSSCIKAIISSVIHPCFSIKPWKCRISNAVAKSGWRRLHRLKCFPAKKPRNEPEARTSEIQSTSGPPEDSTMYPKEAKYIRFCSINSNKISFINRNIVF